MKSSLRHGQDECNVYRKISDERTGVVSFTKYAVGAVAILFASGHGIEMTTLGMVSSIENLFRSSVDQHWCKK